MRAAIILVLIVAQAAVLAWKDRRQIEEHVQCIAALETAKAAIESAQGAIERARRPILIRAGEVHGPATIRAVRYVDPNGDSMAVNLSRPIVLLRGGAIQFAGDDVR